MLLNRGIYNTYHRYTNETDIPVCIVLELRKHFGFFSVWCFGDYYYLGRDHHRCFTVFRKGSIVNIPLPIFRFQTCIFPYNVVVYVKLYNLEKIHTRVILIY